MGLKKWPEQAAFILFRQTINFRGIDRTKKHRFRENLNRVWAWGSTFLK